MSTSRTIAREIGTALAVLAIYLLTVLAPLHQSRASQLDFAELGYATVQSSWVLCTPTGIDGQDSDSLVSKCPATGIGKTHFVLPSPIVVSVDRSLASMSASQLTSAPAILPRVAAPSGGPRAPPVLV